MASEQEVDQTMSSLLRRLEQIDPTYRSMLPSRRTIEATCPDIGVTYHAKWQAGEMSGVARGEAPGRPDIRITVNSDDLVAIADGSLDFARAYAENRVRIRAGMTDLLRLRAVL